MSYVYIYNIYTERTRERTGQAGTEWRQAGRLHAKATEREGEKKGTEQRSKREGSQEAGRE